MVLYELLALESPFESSVSFVQLIDAIRSCPSFITIPAQFSKFYTKPLRELIPLLLTKDPNRRISSKQLM